MSIDVRIAPAVSTPLVDGRRLRVSELHLGGVPRGGVAIVCGPDGFGAVQAVDAMNGFAQHGYESVMAEPVDSEHDGGAVVGHLLGMLTSRGWSDEQIGLVGLGDGARSVLVAAAARTYGAAISYPRDAADLVSGDAVIATHTPWLGLTGAESRSADAGHEVELVHRRMRAASPQHSEVVVYAGVAHCLDDSTEPLVHHAAFDAWQRTVEWLNIHVVPRPTPRADLWRERQSRSAPAAR